MIFIPLLILFSFTTPAKESEMDFIRETFYLAVEDESKLETLEEYLIKNYSANVSVYPPVILAYSGGVEALKAKYVFSPFSKVKHILKSLEMLNEAVSRESGDLEVRFIRFSVLDNIPAILGYGKERSEDKEVIIKELLKKDYSNLDEETQKGLIEYLMESGNVSKDEKALLTKHYQSAFNE